MALKKIFSILISASFLINAAASATIENSIVPFMEKYESLDNLQTKKYSTEQRLDITEALNHKHECIRIATYNILAGHLDHAYSDDNRWPQRLPRIAELLQEMQPDIISVQEFYPAVMEGFLPTIGETYVFFGKPCNDGEQNGILYRKDRFELVESKVWYMSATPDVPDTDTLTMLKLKDLVTGKVVAVFNTHLAFSKIDLRVSQAHFIADKVEEYVDMPVLVMGDLNTFPNWPEVTNMPAFDGDYALKILTEGSLRDARERSILGHLGPLSTFTNASQASPVAFTGLGTPGVFLDHILVSKKVKVLIHAVQSGTVDEHFPSDHMPVLIDFLVD